MSELKKTSFFPYLRILKMWRPAKNNKVSLQAYNFGQFRDNFSLSNRSCSLFFIF